MRTTGNHSLPGISTSYSPYKPAEILHLASKMDCLGFLKVFLPSVNSIFEIVAILMEQMSYKIRGLQAKCKWLVLSRELEVTQMKILGIDIPGVLSLLIVR